MNLMINISRKPAERSLYDANNGNVDGEFIRVEEIGRIYPNLLIVPEYLYEMEFVAFAKIDDVRTENSWKSLEPYIVGIVRGWKILEDNVKYTNGPRYNVSKQEILFKMIDGGRLDVGVYSKKFGLNVIDRLGLKEIKYVMPPLAKRKMYLFLHKKREDLVPRVDNLFKTLKKDGTFEKIRKETLF